MQRFGSMGLEAPRCLGCFHGTSGGLQRVVLELQLEFLSILILNLTSVEETLFCLACGNFVSVFWLGVFERPKPRLRLRLMTAQALMLQLVR